MQVKYILLNIAFFIYLRRTCAVGDESLDIVLSIDESGNNYTKFINLTKENVTWLSSVLCNKDTYSYEIVYNKDYGSVVAYSSKTFEETVNTDSSIHLKEFTCTNNGLKFGCTRMANNSAACTHNLIWIYLDVDLSSTCSDRRASLCPSYPIQAICIKQLEPFNNRTVKCKIPNNDQSTTWNRESTILSTATTDNFTSTFSSASFFSSPSGNIKETSDEDSLPVTLGASIGGGLCIIILLIVIYVCIRKRRRRLHPRKSVTAEYNLKFENDNALDNQLHHHNVCENNRKKDYSAVNKLEVEHRLREKNNGICCILESNNVNSNNLTYSGILQNTERNYVRAENASEMNESNQGHSQNASSNPVFHELDRDYSCINDIQDKDNSSGENVDEKATKESSSNNPRENTYSTLGEQTRSYSETYNIIPMVMNGKEVNNACGNKYDNNISFARHKISEVNYSNIDGALNDVYAKVNKAKRVTD